jgi:hypothetical protein
MYLFVLTSLLLLLSCSALVSHHLFRVNRVHRRLRHLLHGDSSSQVSRETNFWIASSQNNTFSSSKNIPAVSRLDRETGPLPPGAYLNSIRAESRGTTASCLITVGIRPPSYSDAGEDAWKEGVRNCQQLIDSGFNTFRINNSHEMWEGKKKQSNRKYSPSYDALERMQQLTVNTENRHQAEEQFYRKLRQNTPASVLRTCHFMVNLEMPLVLSGVMLIPGMENEIEQASFGNGWMVRESVSKALLRTKKESLDSVVLECELVVLYADFI